MPHPHPPSWLQSRRPTLVLIASFLGSIALFAADPVTDALQQGLLEEEVNRNLPAAIQAYEKAIQSADAQRQTTATALFRLAEGCRRLGRTNDAVAHYRRLVSQFPDQSTLAAMSRTNLAALAPSASTTAEDRTAAPTDPAVAALLREELKLVEQEVLIAQKKMENGKADDTEVRRAQRDLLQLQRKLPENADRDRQVALLQQELALVEANLSVIRKKIEVGAAPPLDEVAARRELLSVQRELAVAQRAPAVSLPPNAAAVNPEPPDSETAEIRRLQTLLQDSPDLANARRPNEGTRLHEAASAGRLRLAEFLLANQADINARDGNGRTPLHRAAQGGHKRMCELLIGRGARAEAADGTGQTPLHLSAMKGYATVTEVLLAAGAKASVNQGDDHGSTPLHLAADEGFPGVIKLLLEARAEINSPDKGGQTPLIRAVLKNQANTAQLLLENGAEVDSQDTQKLNALGHALLGNHEALARLLLDHKAYTESRLFIEGAGLPRNATPLFIAAAMENVELTRLLLEHGADASARAANGATVLHQLTGSPGSLNVLGVLLAHQPPLDARDNEGAAPLHYALTAGRLDLAQALLKAGADPNIPGWNGSATKNWPPLVWAANERGGQPAAQLLLEHGADVNASLTNGWTALHGAAFANWQSLVELLVTNRANVNARGNRPRVGPMLREGSGFRPTTILTTIADDAPGQPEFSACDSVTPLHLAVANVSVDLTRYLIEHGADVNAQDANGRTPLHFAVNQFSLELVELLLKAKADQHAKDAAGISAFDMSARPMGVRLIRPGVRFATPTDIQALLVKYGAQEQTK